MQTIKVVQLPITQGKDHYSLEHPVTALRAQKKGDELEQALMFYQDQPEPFNFNGQQRYLVDYLALLVANQVRGDTQKNVQVTDAEKDAALGGHLLSRARIIRHVMGKFARSLLEDTAVDWEALSVQWFFEIMDSGLSAPEGYEEGLKYVKNHVCATFTSSVAEAVCPEAYSVAEAFFEQWESDKDDQKFFIEFGDNDASHRFFPFDRLSIKELEKLDQFADRVLRALELPAEQAAREQVVVDLIHPGNLYRFISFMVEANGYWTIFNQWDSVGNQAFLPMERNDAFDFACDIKGMLSHKGSITDTMIHEVAPMTLASELFVVECD